MTNESQRLEYAKVLTAYDEAVAAGRADREPDSGVPSRFADDFEQARECLSLLEQCWPRTAGDNGATTDAGPCNGQTDRPATDRSKDDVWFGRFRILRYLGSGGGGVVLAAFDPVLDRKLALKIPNLEVVFLPDRQRRFIQEARTAASLNHPNINPVYDVGQVGPISYITSAICEGPTLADWLRDHLEPLSPLLAARLIGCLASAVEHAHERGVWHRDLKPSNVLLDPLPANDCRVEHNDAVSSVWMNFIPKLTDFGLAKVTRADISPTRSGAILGTPAYMSPEQAAGRLDEVGPWSDVYSLGVVLYELLVKRPPFQVESQIVASVTRPDSTVAEPRIFRLPRPDVPPDLEAICLRCLNHDPRLRYPSARELADDIARFLAGEPTLSRPAGIGSRAVCWISRRRALLAMSGMTGFFMATGSTGLLLHRQKIKQAEQVAADYQLSSQQSGELIRRAMYAEAVRGAHQAWQNTDLATARELLDRCQPAEGEEDLRGFEWRYVRRLCQGGMKSFRMPIGEARAVAYSDDANHVLAANEKGTVYAWNAVTEKLVGQFQIHSSAVRAMASSPVDPWLVATTGKDGYVRLWRWSQGDHHEIAQEFSSMSAHCVVFSPDGATLAVGNEDRTVTGWEVKSGERRFHFVAHEQAVRGIAFSPDGRQLATVSPDETAKVWNLDSSLDPVRTFAMQTKPFAVAFSPDGRTLATGGDHVYLWSVDEERDRIRLPGNKSQVLSLAFSPDGKLLAATGYDMTVRTCNVDSHVFERIYRGHTRMIFDVKFSPLNNSLISGGKDGVVNLWGGGVPQDRLPVDLGGPGSYSQLAISRDGSRLAFSVRDVRGSRVELRSMGNLERILIRPMDSAVASVAFTRDSRALVICSNEGPVFLWNVETDTLSTLDDTTRGNYHCVVSADGRFAAVSANDNSPLRVIDLSGKNDVLHLPGFRGVDFSPDRNLLAMEVQDGTNFSVGLWDLPRSRFIARFATRNCPINCIAFSPDGCSLATGGFDGAATLWDVRARIERRAIRAHVGEVAAVAFTPDGTSLVTAGHDGTLNFWDALTGHQRLSLGGIAGTIRSIAFTPDGRVLVTGQAFPKFDSPTVLLWNAPHSNAVRDFSPASWVRSHDITMATGVRKIDGVFRSRMSWLSFEFVMPPPSMQVRRFRYG